MRSSALLITLVTFFLHTAFAQTTATTATLTTLSSSTSTPCISTLTICGRASSSASTTFSTAITSADPIFANSTMNTTLSTAVSSSSTAFLNVSSTYVPTFTNSTLTSPSTSTMSVMTQIYTASGTPVVPGQSTVTNMVVITPTATKVMSGQVSAASATNTSNKAAKPKNVSLGLMGTLVLALSVAFIR